MWSSQCAAWTRSCSAERAVTIRIGMMRAEELETQARYPPLRADPQPVAMTSVCVRAPGGARSQALQDEEGGPLAVEITGFEATELNGRYLVRPGVVVHGRRTYWAPAEAEDAAGTRQFLCWQASLARWAVCAWVLLAGAVGWVCLRAWSRVCLAVRVGASPSQRAVRAGGVKRQAGLC